MTEREWVKTFTTRLSDELLLTDNSLRVADGKKLTYASEILFYYTGEKSTETRQTGYETDILIYEEINNTWKPRVVIEGKKDTVTTHDSITYSQKSFTHKNVHPYLRYGILLGNRKDYPLPGRLFRHGINFDFMLSWVSFSPSECEWQDFFSIIQSEVQASRNLEEMIFNSKSTKRKKYTTLHKPLIIK